MEFDPVSLESTASSLQRVPGVGLFCSVVGLFCCVVGLVAFVFVGEEYLDAFFAMADDFTCLFNARVKWRAISYFWKRHQAVIVPLALFCMAAADMIAKGVSWWLPVKLLVLWQPKPPWICHGQAGCSSRPCRNKSAGAVATETPTDLSRTSRLLQQACP